MSRSSSRWRSLTPPGSYSIVVTATVAPTANTVTSPRSAPTVETIRETPSVMSTTSPSPAVCRRSIPPETVIAPDPDRSSRPGQTGRPDLDPGEPPLAELDDPSVQLSLGEVEHPARHEDAVELHRALGDAAARLR